MDPTPERPVSPTPAAGLAHELPAQGADLVETVVTALRDKTVRPLTLATRFVVYGLVVLAAALVAVTFVSIALIRVLTVNAFGGRVWIADAVVGGVFLVLGIVAWTQRASRSARTSSPA